MISAFRHFAVRHRLLSPGDRIAVAVSGGADSVCLLRLLLELRDDVGLALSVIHFNHQLRAEAEEEAQFVHGLAQRFECRFFLGSGDVRARAAAQQESLETAARHLRYEFFSDLFGHGAVDKIATGHTRDDQAETVLMKILRGAGTRGLSAIHAVQPRANGLIVRPLLFAARTDVEAHLTDLGQPWRTDASNADPAHTRNRVRHQLMPALRAFNPEVDAALARTAAIMCAEEEYWTIETERALPFVLLPGTPVRGGGRAATSGHAFAIATEPLLVYPLALQRHVVRAALARLDAAPTFEETDQILALGGALPTGHDVKPGKWVTLNERVRVRRLHRELQFTAAEAPLPSTTDVPLAFTFDGESTAVRAGNILLRLSLAPLGNASAAGAALTLPLALTLRAWRAGDRFQPAHTRTAKKVKELLQEKKLAPEVRAQWPVLEHATGILWVRGFPAATTVIRAADGSAKGSLRVETL